MIQIESVEIHYFRSIYKTRFRNLTDVVVLAGRNDIGKSNILKALNLFFNNQTDWNTPFDFTRDFSRRRLSEVRQETIKGRQFIKITVGFLRGNRYEKSLPPRFTVTRTWYRDRPIPEERNSLQSLPKKDIPASSPDRARASLQRYLNTVRFEYIPAIKDSLFFTYILSRLQDLILDKRSSESGIAGAVEQLNSMVESEALDLRNEFENVTGVSTDIRLPSELGDLFKAFAVETKVGEDNMPLNLRGDGIRSRFLPSLLHYVSKHSTRKYIWGFEEPENSLEHALSTKLAHEVVNTYCQDAQIFVTSHSPAFFGLREANVSIYRVLREDNSTIAQQVRGQGDTPTLLPPDLLNVLEQELGLMEFQEQYQREYEAKAALLKTQLAEVEAIRGKLDQENRPVLLTEGKWDVKILEEAWKRLHKDKPCPFRILSCDPMPGNIDGESGGAGGWGTLKTYLETARPDLPITVGLFDRDVDGYQKGFAGLNANFENMAGEPDIKIQKAGTAAAIVLPVIKGREQYANALNLVIEYYFEDEFLNKKVNGKGLELIQPEVEQRVVNTGQKLSRVVTVEPYLRQIKSGTKKAFAEQVVPKLPDNAFKHFSRIFSLVTKAISELKAKRTTLKS